MRTVVREKTSAASSLLLREVVDEEMDVRRSVGAKVVMSAFRGREAWVEEPEEPLFELLQVLLTGEDGRGSDPFRSAVGVFGILREVRPPPGRIVLSAAVSWRRGLRNQFSGAA